MVVDEWSKKGLQLNKHLRLRTSPVAVKFCKSIEEIPRNVIRPMRNFEIRIANCQAIGMARMRGLTIGLTWEEDMWCIRPALLYGFVKKPDYVWSGEINYKTHNATLEAAKKTEEALLSIPFGTFCGIMFSPLERTIVEPQVILVYGTPTQINKIIGAALWKGGGALKSVFTIGEVCHKISRAYLTGEVQVAFPGGGDRMFGNAEEHEAAVAMPANKLDDILEGLKAIASITYPIRKFLRWEPKVAPRLSYYAYVEWMKTKDTVSR